MKVAITGGTGLLGRYFLRCLASQNEYIPIVLSRNSIENSNINAEVRITDYSTESLVDLLSDIEAVVHLAAVRGSSNNIRDFDENTFITQNLYKACIRNNISNVVYSSSIAVYSEGNNLPWNENEPPSPQTIYGISKVTCEYLGDYFTRNHGLKVKNLRFPPLFGVEEQNELSNKRMLSRFIFQASKNEKLVVFSSNPSVREFLYAKDAASATLLALKKDQLFGTFNIGSNQPITNKAVAEYVNSAFKNEGNLYIENIGEKFVGSSYMTSEKARLLLEYRPKYSFYEAMIDIYKEINNV